MGPSGAGKTTVGRMLAQRLGAQFHDADDLHPERNRALMAAGTPLRDEERWPWLVRVGALLAADPGCVVACSALRRAYRDSLRAGTPSLVFVHLRLGEADLGRRLRERSHAYMPASLLQSQLDALEPLEPDEPGFVIDASVPADRVVEAITDALSH